jgi:hypothetical protein
LKQGSGLFLEAQGHPLPEHSQTKSSSALSRFLNINPWSTREMIRTVRNHILKQIQEESKKGRKPFLQIIVDLTTLEKCGKFKEFENLISVYNGKRGVHLVVLYEHIRKVAYTLEFPRLERKGYDFTRTIRTKTYSAFTQIFQIKVSSLNFS